MFEDDEVTDDTVSKSKGNFVRRILRVSLACLSLSTKNLISQVFSMRIFSTTLSIRHKIIL